jgi:hypothetical protein
MKSLCALSKKGVKQNLPKIMESVRDPQFICEKCARVANTKERLCKSVKINTMLKKI